MESSLRNLIARRDLLREITLSDLHSQSKETSLGWLWWILDPIFMMLVYWALIAGILGRGSQYEPYPVFILCAMLPWKYVANCSTQACMVLRRGGGLIKSVPFPTVILPMAQILAEFFFFLIGMGILLAAGVLFGVSPTVYLVQLPLLMILQIALSIGISLILAAYGALVHDLVAFVQYVLRIGFYLTPTLYGTDMVTERFFKGSLKGTLWEHWLPIMYMLNPITLLITGYRDAIFYGRMMQASYWALLVGETAVLLAIGYRVFIYYDRRVIKFL